MVCLRHQSCRRGIIDRIKAWPTATHPRYFAVVTLGALGYLALFPLLAGDMWLLWWALNLMGS
jgi:hypothetical protein